MSLKVCACNLSYSANLQQTIFINIHIIYIYFNNEENIFVLFKILLLNDAICETGFISLGSINLIEHYFFA